MCPRQVKVTPDLHPVGQQARQPNTPSQHQLKKLRPFHDERLIEGAFSKPQRERYLQPRQIRAAHDLSAPQPDPTAIDQTLQFLAAAAQQHGVHPAERVSVTTIKDAARAGGS